MFAKLFKSKPNPAFADLPQKVGKGEIILIDIRAPSEVSASGKAKGALTIPLNTLQMRADPRSPECHKKLKSSLPIAVYCATGARSGMAVRMLRKLGHETVENVGSLSDWHRSGGIVTR